MDTAQWPQGIGVVTTPMESIAIRAVEPAGVPPSLVLEKRAAPPVRPQKEQALNCPRCNSSNTKFCYYNNYSLSQPRYFCKTCRRYWTEGGSLRNVPIGGGSRKNKRSPSSSSPNTTSLSSSNYANNHSSNLSCCPPQTYAPVPHHYQHQIIMNPSKIMMIHAAGQDLNLAYPHQPPTSGSENHDNVPHRIPNPTLSAMELLKINSFPVSESGCGGGGLYSATGGFSRGEYKPALNFSVEGFENGSGGYGGERGVEESSATGGGCRLLFPFEGLKQQEGVSSEGDENANTTNSSADGYWNGMSGSTEGGPW